MFTVLYSETFEKWFNNLTLAERESIFASIELLQQHGHQLGRPHVDTMTNSKIKNLKELRTQHAGKPYRSFFVFDPLRQAILLCGGDKTGDKRFYRRMIALAEQLYDDYLTQLEDKNETI